MNVYNSKRTYLAVAAIVSPTECFCGVKEKRKLDFNVFVGLLVWIYGLTIKSQYTKIANEILNTLYLLKI